MDTPQICFEQQKDSCRILGPAFQGKGGNEGPQGRAPKHIQNTWAPGYLPQYLPVTLTDQFSWAQIPKSCDD